MSRAQWDFIIAMSYTEDVQFNRNTCLCKNGPFIDTFRYLREGSISIYMPNDNEHKILPVIIVNIQSRIPDKLGLSNNPCFQKYLPIGVVKFSVQEKSVVWTKALLSIYFRYLSLWTSHHITSATRDLIAVPSILAKVSYSSYRFCHVFRLYWLQPNHSQTPIIAINTSIATHTYTTG